MWKQFLHMLSAPTDEHFGFGLAAMRKIGKRLGRIRLQVVENCSGDELLPFIQANVASGSTVMTDGWKGYNKLEEKGYTGE